jgi:hypothetical protein
LVITPPNVNTASVVVVVFGAVVVVEVEVEVEVVGAGVDDSVGVATSVWTTEVQALRKTENKRRPNQIRIR